MQQPAQADPTTTQLAAQVTTGKTAGQAYQSDSTDHQPTYLLLKTILFAEFWKLLQKTILFKIPQ